VGRRIDRHPQLRALLYSDEMKFSEKGDYFEDENCEISLDDATDRAMKCLIESYCGGLLFKPNQLSLVDAIKANFRCPQTEVSALSSNQMTGLCFMAIRILNTTKRLGCELFNVDETSSKMTKPTSTSRSFHQLAKLQLGTVLVSHPLNLVRPYNNSALLVISVDDNDGRSTCTSIMLNKPFNSSKSKKIRQTIPKELHKCILYCGGNNEHIADEHFTDNNILVLHRHEELVGVSTKIVFPRSVKDLTGCIDEVSLEVSSQESKLTPVDSSSSERVHQEAVGEADNSNSDAADSQLDNDYIYMTYDLTAVSELIAKAAMSPKDIKIVYGCYRFYWDDLEREISANKFFMVTPKLPHDIIMMGGLNMWRMVLRGMGGEYAALGSSKNVMGLPAVRRQALFNEWNKHPKYGQEVFRMKPAMDDDYEEDEEYDENEYDYFIVRDEEGEVIVEMPDDGDEDD